ncbi:MAG: hypothetical protein ABJC55_06555 [Algoriphagus sp.]
MILFLSAFFFFSCDNEKNCEGIDLDKEYEIAINERLQICPKNFYLTLLNIQDSRCPNGIVCIWQGMIVIEATVTIDGKEHDFQLSTNETASGFPVQLSTEGYIIKLIDATPYPNQNDSSNPDNKRAVLLISKRSS